MARRCGAYRKLRKKFLNNKLLNNELNCFYCGQTDLIINHHDDPEIPSYRRATIDHIIPVSKGGSQLNKNNLRVACLKCNMKKGDK